MSAHGYKQTFGEVHQRVRLYEPVALPPKADITGGKLHRFLKADITCPPVQYTTQGREAT